MDIAASTPPRPCRPPPAALSRRRADLGPDLPATATLRCDRAGGVGVVGAVSDYGELSRRIRAAGLLERRPGHDAARIAANLVLLGLGWVGFAVLGASWWQLGTAVFLGMLFTQCGFLAHDAAHKQICRTRRGSQVLGLLYGNLAIGLSYGWWVDKHNRHHAHPNDIDRDPDVGPGALVFNESQAGLRRGLARWVTRRQAVLLAPMMALEGMNLHAASVRALPRRTSPSRWIEGGLLAAHAAGYLAAVICVLSPLQAVAFVAVQQAVFGLSMSAAFAPNHKGMPLLTQDEDLDYLRRQVLTSRNVHGGRLVDIVLGGLNYQIEHHLFPSMPRRNLPLAQPLVHAFCRQHGIAYRQSSVISSYGQVLRHLHAVGAPLRGMAARPVDQR